MSDETREPSPLLSSNATKASASASVVLAMVLATLVNVLVSRHYRRWDVTRGGLYTLSEATIGTLHDLPEPVKIYLLLPAHAPLTSAVQHLLDGYLAETSRLEVTLVDPDQHPADLLALAQRSGVGVDKEDSHVVASAAAIVARGDRREIIRTQDLVEIDAEDDVRHRPRLEQAFTGALRAVGSVSHPRACFSSGHGEDGAQPLREQLARNGYELVNVEAARSPRDGAAEPLTDCSLLVIAGPTEPIPADDAGRFASYLQHGGAGLLAVGPEADGGDRAFLDLGLGPMLAPFGVGIDSDVVFELDPHFRAPNGRGETFAPTARMHPATQGLARLADKGVVPVLTMARSIQPTGGGDATVMPLLVTSDQAFGMVDFFTWAKTVPPPVPGAADRKGPLTVAVAAERPPASPDGKHGGRLVVVGSAGALQAANWQREELRGTALFVEGAIAWLTARPVIVDIPQKPEVTAGLRVSDAWLASTFRYVVLYMPLAAALIGFAIHLRRRGERRDPERAKP